MFSSSEYNLKTKKSSRKYAPISSLSLIVTMLRLFLQMLNMASRFSGSYLTKSISWMRKLLSGTLISRKFLTVDQKQPTE